MNDIIQVWLNTKDVSALLDPSVLIYFFLAIGIFFIGKIVNQKISPYDLNHQLTTADNKAIGLSFAGYILAVSIIISGLLAGDMKVTASESFGTELRNDIFNTLLWSFIGILLLHVARFLNDKLLLRRFNHFKELVDNKNIGVGAVQCASHIGSALIINVALSGDDQSTFAWTLIDTLVYFVIAQFAFILFGLIYQKITRFDLHDEIEKGNAAAGVAFGMNLVAVSIVLSGYLAKYDSLIGLMLWLLISMILLILGRLIIDKVILPGSLLDEEISQDQNWSAAIVEGSSVLGIALVLISII